MSLSITGYILDPVRVGSSNSPFTLTPDNYISDQGAFDAAYPETELAPRTEYLVQVLAESTGGGTGPGGKTVLADAVFAWTKNEGDLQDGLQVPFARFDYADQDGRFKTLPGAPRELAGTLTLDANTIRLVVTPPDLTDLSTFPVRVAVGPESSSGTTFPVTLVTGAFGLPASGTVELDTVTGELNWDNGDLTTFEGSLVHFQRQAFFTRQDSNGNIGLVGSLLVLNPLPATGQYPLLKIGERSYLTPVERATEGAFSANPASGTVEWARNTGRLKLNSIFNVAFAGDPMIYDGVAFATFQVATESIGLAEDTPSGTLTIYAPEGSDLYFRIPGVVQFPETLFVDAFSGSGVVGQVEVRRSDGAVQLSSSDRATYTGQTLEAVSPDVEMEQGGIDRGHVLRLFRTIVDPGATNPDAKDVTSVYSQVGATLADPIVGQPFVSLPSLPLEDQDLVVTVEQGTGSFLGVLNRLDVGSPPVGKGFLLDFDDRQLAYAERKALEVLPAPILDFATTQLPNAPVVDSDLVVELETEPGSNVYETLTQDEDFVIDLASGVITYTETSGGSLVSGIATSVNGTTLTVSDNLATAGIAPGDFLLLTSGLSEGLYSVVLVTTPFTATVTPSFPFADTDVPYEIRRGKEILVDRFFRDIPPIDPGTSVERLGNLGAVTNSPRLSINPSLALQSRFRFGKTTFSTVTSIVTVFTAPALLPQGTVEVDENTGELNFSQVDVTAGGDVYWARELTLGVDYAVQAPLGFIEFAERMLEREEVYLRYTAFDANGNEVPVEERGAFLVPKEITQAHPSPVSTLSFNPDGREVAVNPAPSAFRGGRPQSSDQVTFNVGASTVTFLADAQITDALPHGPIVQPEETVYIDYYIHEALGGEKNLTVTQVPMATAQVVITAEDDAGNPLTSFTVKGDRTADFVADSLLRVANSEVYLLAAPTFNGTLTTVNLAQSPPQVFRTDLTNPTLEVTSGVTRRFPVGLLPSYFEVESTPYDPVARGQKKFKLQGDLAAVYVGGVVVSFTDLLTFQEYFLVEGSSYDSDTNRTTVTLALGVSRQHETSSLLRSVRTILESPTGTVTTDHIPVLTLPFQAYRQVEGQVGVLLTRGVDYTLDDSGFFTFTEALGLNEEIGLLYTGTIFIEAGRRTRASWTFTLVPSIGNGLLNQILTMDYSTYVPDTFFYRVETMTNFRGEVVEQFRDDAKASSPSQGPSLENSSSQQLFEQGAEGLYFTERDLANQDIIARSTLKYYNDLINELEDWLSSWDGRVIGDHDGKFLFDGLIDNPIRVAFVDATNQIDDLIQIKSRTRRAFEAANYSRFYPTARMHYGIPDDPTGLSTGTPILDLEETALRQVSSVRNRFPWAVTTEAAPAGSSTFQVDEAEGEAELLRPGLNVVPNLQVVITARDGSFIVPDGAPATVVSTTNTSVTLAAPVGPAVPIGATIRMATTDSTYRAAYTVGIDVGADLDNGFLTHIENDDVPAFFQPNASPPAARALDVLCQIGATNTAPDRFPALDGGTTDDDADRQFPILNGNPDSELLSLTRELSLINEATGTLRDIISLSLVGSGVLLSSTLLDIGVPWDPPSPKVGDLVRLHTSLEGSSYFHRVTSVGVTDVTVEPAFQASSGVVTFEVTRGLTLLTSVTGVLTSTTVLSDAFGNYIVEGVQPGHTVVVTLGTFVGQRRQVLSVDSAIQLTVESPFSGIGAVGSYDVVNSLATFGGTNSLQADWGTEITRELRSLEGQDFIDFSDILVAETTAVATIAVNTVVMADFDALTVFLSLEDPTDLSVTSATFNGSPLILGSSVLSTSLALYTYSITGQTGVTGNLSITAASAAANMKIFALKLSSIKAPIVFATGSVAVSGTLSTTSTSREAGDLVLSMACSSASGFEQYPVEDHNTLIPLFRSANSSATLRATRATSAKQTVTSQFEVAGESCLSTVIISKEVAIDGIAGATASEKATLEAFFDTTVPDRGLGDLVADITSGTTITGDFTNVAADDVLYVRHGPNAGVYTIATANDVQATVVEGFPAAPETSVTFRAGDLRVPSIAALQSVFPALQGVEASIVDAGILEIQQHCPVLVYRNATPSLGLPGTPDSVFTSVSGRLTTAGARARPIGSLAEREAFLTARGAITDTTTIEAVLGPGDKLYDGRYVWIDGRINLETGILPKATRAVENREKALERIVTNLTKLLAM